MVGSARRGGLQTTKILLQVGNIVAVFAGLEVVTDGVEVDTSLGQEGLIFLEAVDEVPLMRFLLAPTGRLRRHHAALDVGLNAVGAGFLLIATDLSLLTQDT